MTPGGTEPTDQEATFFATPEEFRRWLADHHAERDELWVGYYKKATGRPSMTWPESVDEALCYGWIDGLRKSIDDQAYRIRFTPRRTTSVWSRVNLERMTVLRAEGRMQQPGLDVYEARDPAKDARYSFEQRDARLSAAQQAEFRANAAAWAFWQAQPPGYRKQATWWVVSAKRASTRARRLATLIDDAANGLRIKPLRRS